MTLAVSARARHDQDAVTAPTTPLLGTGWADRLAALSTWAVLLAGITGLVSGLMPAERHRLTLVVNLLGLPVASSAAVGSVALGVVLVLLARGLRRRQRRAWAIAVPVLAVGALLHLARALDVEEATTYVVGLAVLVGARSRFTADPDPMERRNPLVLLAGLATTSIAAGLVLLWANADSIAGHPGLIARLQSVLAGLVGLTGPVVLRTDRAGDLLSATLLAFGITTLLLPLLVALRPIPARVGLQDEDRSAVRAMLQTRPDSLGWFALRDDKQLITSPSGKAAVSYRVENGVALVSADPLGDPEAWPGAIRAFLEMADSHGWTPGVLGCSEQGGTAWTRAGLTALELGDEAVVDATTFTLEGRAMRGVRQAVRRTERAGYDVQVRRSGDVDEAEWAMLRERSDRWRDGPVERGFSMALGRLGAPGDEDCVVVTGSRDGEVEALLHFVPWGTDGLSLDLMRRTRGTNNGVNELLIVRALEAAASLGVRQVSLNFAVFRSALENGARLGAGPVLRAWRGTLVFASRFWQIDSLYRFNAKFGPTWHPRYLCFRRVADLPRVMIAAAQAEAFLPRAPSLPRLPWT